MGEAATVSLRHVTFVTSGTVFLPDGPALKSDKGVLTIPLSRPLAILGAWYDGYRIDVETGKEIKSVDAFIKAQKKAVNSEPAPVLGPPKPEGLED